jgi:MFS family permease
MPPSSQNGSRNELAEPLLRGNDNNNFSVSDDSPPILVDGLPRETSYLIKSLYFVEALGSATWGRFGTIYYNLHHLTSQQIGLLEGLMTIVPTLCLPIWGIVADQFNSRKAVYVITKAVSTVLLLTLSLPYVYHSYARIVAMSLLTKVFVADGVLDSYTLELLGTANKRLYGRYRLYASLSWGLGAIFMGYVVDYYGSFQPNFILYGLLGSLCLGLVVAKIPNSSPDQEDLNPTSSPRGEEEERLRAEEGRDAPPVEPNTETTTPESASTAREPVLMDLVYLALRPRVALFLLEVIAMGAGMATVERLLFLYMVNDLQSSTLLCGLSVGVNVIFELPIFWYATWMVGKLGLDGVQLLSMACFVVRVYGYTLLTPDTKWWILPLEILHGVTFACFWVVSTDVSKTLINETHQKWNTTIPVMVQTLYAAIGAGFGSVFGGWAMQVWGSRPMYRCMAGLIGTVWVFHLIGSVVVRCCGEGSKSFLPDYTTTHNDQEEEEEDASTVSGANDQSEQEEAFAALLVVEQEQEQRLL